jgi:hypothetical protein
MELPFRQKGDELLRPGEMLAMRERFRRHAKTNDLTTVMAYAFDRRTRMLPFVHIDKRMTPAGVRGIGSAFLDAGLRRRASCSSSGSASRSPRSPARRTHPSTSSCSRAWGSTRSG